MTIGLKSGNDVLILFSEPLDGAGASFEMKKILGELRRDLSLRKAPLRITREIPGCFLEFEAGSLRGSVMKSNTPATLRLFDVQMILGQGKMTAAKRQIAASHKAHVSVTLWLDEDSAGKRPPMSLSSALKRISKSTLTRLQPQEDALVYWGPTASTLTKSEAFELFGATGWAEVTKTVQPSIFGDAMRKPNRTEAHPDVSEHTMPPTATNLRQRMGHNRAARKSTSAFSRTVDRAVQFADTGFGKVAAGLALGVILQTALSDTLNVENAMAALPQSPAVVITAQ
jgi:hypothetical protein